jgi:hypothetical protein
VELWPCTKGFKSSPDDLVQKRVKFTKVHTNSDIVYKHMALAATARYRQRAELQVTTKDMIPQFAMHVSKAARIVVGGSLSSTILSLLLAFSTGITIPNLISRYIEKVDKK